MWENDDPRAVFMQRLVRERAVEFMQCPKYLRSLRHRNDLAIRDQKMFGHVWASYYTNVYQLIAKAHGETWDAETEEKERSRAADASQPRKIAPVNQRADRDDNVVAACEKGTRGGQHELQGQHETGVRVVEEDEGRGEVCGAEETAKTEIGRARSGSFYRRAGAGAGGSET